MTFVLSVDGGVSTGIVLAQYTDDSPWERLGVWQFTGGVRGFLNWRRDHIDLDYGVENSWYFSEAGGNISFHDTATVAEKFVPLNNPGFSHTLGSVEPLRIEGAMIALGMMPAEYPDDGRRWARPNEMYAYGGRDLVEKKKRMNEWNKAHDLHLTGKDVGQPNADDARSAQAHSLAYMRRIRHAPTLRKFWGSDV